MAQQQEESKTDEEQRSNPDSPKSYRPYNDPQAQPTDEDEEEEENAPLLFVDVNLGTSEQKRIVVYEGDSAAELAKNFCIEHDLDETT